MRRGLGIVGAVVTALAPLQAAALSCMESSPRHAYWSQQESTDRYLLVHGAFFDIRPAFPDNKKRADEFFAEFKGNKASRKAFDQPFETKVTLIFPDFTGIAGADYNSADGALGWSGEVGLIWLKQTETGYEAIYDPCGGFIDVDPENIGPALDCLNGRRCPKPY